MSIQAPSRSERAVQLGGEVVIVELAHRPLPGGGTHPPPQLGVVEQPRQRLGCHLDVGRTIDNEPGLAVDHSVRGPARAPGHLGHAGGRSFQEDDPESLLLEAEPPSPAEHRPDVGRADEVRQVGIAHLSEQHYRRLEALLQGSKTPGVPALAGDRHDKIIPNGLQAGGRLDEDVHPLARNESAVADDQASPLPATQSDGDWR